MRPREGERKKEKEIIKQREQKIEKQSAKESGRGIWTRERGEENIIKQQRADTRL